MEWNYKNVIIRVESDGCFYFSINGNVDVAYTLNSAKEKIDKAQLFTNGEDWCIWREEESFNSVPVDVVEHYGIPSNLNLATYHKATADEIIEYFTMEGGAE